MNKIFQWVILLGIAYTIMGCEGTTYPSINNWLYNFFIRSNA